MISRAGLGYIYNSASGRNHWLGKGIVYAPPKYSNTAHARQDGKVKKQVAKRSFNKRHLAFWRRWGRAYKVFLFLLLLPLVIELPKYSKRGNDNGEKKIDHIVSRRLRMLPEKNDGKPSEYVFVIGIYIVLVDLGRDIPADRGELGSVISGGGIELFHVVTVIFCVVSTAIEEQRVPGLFPHGGDQGAQQA